MECHKLHLVTIRCIQFPLSHLFHHQISPLTLLPLPHQGSCHFHQSVVNMLVLYVWICILLPHVWGNTEKTIFFGPSPVDVQSAYSELNMLRLVPLNPGDFTIRTHLNAGFPNEFKNDEPSSLRDGIPSWFILYSLTKGQRYEVRICWAATVGHLLHPKSSS